MLLERVVRASQAVSEASGRNAKVGLLAACLREAAADEVQLVVGYLAGDTRRGRIGVARSTLHAVAVAAAAEASLALHEVDAAFARIAGLSGPGSSRGRAAELTALFSRATAAEQAFLRRLLSAELRQGALEGVMLDAIAQGFEVSSAVLRRAAMLSGDLAATAALARERGEAGLSELRVQLFRPLQPMLAQPASDVADALAQLEHAALEHKLDGARIQAHRDGDEVRVYSRQLNEVSAAVPEVVELVRSLPVRSVVLDGEAIALHDGGRPRPFQVTMRRFGRKLERDALRRELPLTPFFFDVVHVDGEDLLDTCAEDRQRALEGLLPAASLVERIVTSDLTAAEAFLEHALSQGHEGLVAKDLRSRYEAGRRGGAWLKVKRAHTLDLVVLAAEWGSGRRRGFLSNLHLGARGEHGDFVMLGKTFKGMTDAMLAQQTAALLELELRRDAVAVYVEPRLVVEVAFDGIQASPQYPGGVALRFARVKRYRPDKSPAEADTIDTVRALHVVG